MSGANSNTNIPMTSRPPLRKSKSAAIRSHDARKTSRPEATSNAIIRASHKMPTPSC